MWFKNLLVYRLNKWDVTPAILEEKLSGNAIQACSAMEMQRLGWVSPKEEGQPFVHTLGSQMLICLGVEKKLLPTTVINKFAKSRAADIEEQQGYKPGRKQMKQIKEAVTDELLPRAFALRRHTFAWISPTTGIMVVDAANLAKADELIEMLIKTVDGIALTPLKTNTSPTAAMTSWLAGDDLSSAFTVDRDCELRGSGEERATVRYVRHTLEAEEIAKHITAGKEVTRLAMTWSDKISFVLHDNLQIKRIAALDILKDQAEGSDQEDMFDTDFAIMTGELQRLLVDVIDVLGGESAPAV
ncbi:recombination-associated protein RdgC [mine drainage metagenome]|uniref:Recombination-associated protein RdgC n=1 Tax=mine drainage metagenome TaxID=410659 RepID=A0A1J5SJH5_9ZZZZ